MRTTTIKRTRKELFKSKRNSFIYLGLFLLVFGFFLINGIVSYNKTLSDEYLFQEKTGTVEELKDTTFTLVISDEDNLTIELAETFKDQINENDTLTITIANTNLKTYTIYKLEKAGTVIVDNKLEFVESCTKQLNSQLILFGSIILIIIGFIIFNIIKIFKTPLEESYDYIEVVLTRNRVISNQMFDNNSKTYKILKKVDIIKKSILGVIVVALLVIIFFPSILDGNKSVVIGAMALFFIAAALSMFLITPSLHNKNLQTFVEDYKFYLDNGSNTQYYNNLPFDFLTEGLKYKSKKDPKAEEQYSYYDYHQVNLYTCVLYSKNNFAANIFICSELPDDDTFKDVKEFIIPLTSKVYNQIKENGVYIRGLEKIIDNLQDEIKENSAKVKYTPIIKKYLD